MGVVVSFQDYLPPARYDAIPWTAARVYEAASPLGPWTLIATVALSPLDADPANPAPRSFTTELGTADGLWYRVVFADATGDVSEPSEAIQNVAGDGSSYVSVYDLKSSLGLPTTATIDADMTRAAMAASRMVDSLTGRTFYAGAAAETRWFTPVSANYLLVGDMIAVDALELDGTAYVADTDWFRDSTDVLRPINGAFRFPVGRRAVSVTGQWGWIAPPVAVKEAAQILAVQLYKRVREAPFGVVAVTMEGEAVRISRADPQIDGLLAPYRRSSMVE